MEMIAKTPPMGWNSWNTFMDQLDEKTLKEVALSLKKQGFLEAGYNYFCLDDGWESRERQFGSGVDYDKMKFPSGLKAFGDFLHDLGFKFGIYSCAGTLTCGGYPGSYGYEYEDAERFAQWGVDLLKYDQCNVPNDCEGKFLYRRMGQALRETGRPILYSMCNWGYDASETWARSTGAHIYRIGSDSRDTWESVCSSISVIKEINLPTYSGPNCYADPDFLIAGMNGSGAVSNLGEVIGPNADFGVYKTQFSLWCMLCAPLIMSHDPRSEDEQTNGILLNSEMIAVNQDPAGIPAFLCKIHKQFEIQTNDVWAKPLANGDIVLGLFNRSDRTVVISAGFHSLGWLMSDHVEVYDLWAHQALGEAVGYVSAKVEPRNCAVFRLHRKKNRKKTP